MEIRSWCIQNLRPKKPEAVKGFLSSPDKGYQRYRRQSGSCGCLGAIAQRCRTKDVELERLKYALEKNIVTKEVKANGYGAIDTKRLAEAIDQLAMTYSFEKKPAAADFLMHRSYRPRPIGLPSKSWASLR